MTSVIHSTTSTSTSVKITPRADSQKSGGRNWKDLTKSVAKAAGYAALASLAMLSVAALIVGIIALVNPVGLGLIGAGIAGVITGGVAFAVENAVIVLVVGGIGLTFFAIAALISFVVKKCFPIDIDDNSSSRQLTSQSGSSASVT